MPTALCNNANLYYETEGHSGSPVLLIMGLGAQGAAWGFQRPALRERHRLAWYDHRGIGRSDPLSGAVTVAGMAADAVGLLDALGWADAHVVGISMGGMIAQELALSARERVRSLALIATQAGGAVGWLPPSRGLQVVARLAATRGDERLSALRGLAFSGDYLDQIDPTVLRANLRGVDQPPDTRVILAQLLAVLRHNTAARLHALAGLPTLIFKPEHDVLVRPEQSDRLHDLIPGSTLVSLPDTGHAAMMQGADVINPLLLDHFAAVDAG